MFTKTNELSGKTEPDFLAMRIHIAMNAQALSKEEANSRYQIDRALNPHNEPMYIQRREEAQIQSDAAFGYADKFLRQQYGREYDDWMKKNGFVVDEHRHLYKLREVAEGQNYLRIVRGGF